VLGDVDDIVVSAVRAPALSVLQWLVAAGAPRAAHTAFASGIALATPPGSTRVVSALGIPGLAQLPEYLIPVPPTHDSTVRDTVQAVRDAPADDLAAEVSAWPAPLPPEWRGAVENPARWREAYARAVETAWTFGRRHWQGGRHPIDREIARIGTAVVTGTVAALLNSLHPRLRYRDGVLQFRHSCPTSVPLGDRRLVLVPVLAAPHRIIVSFDRSDVAYVAYPVLGQGRVRHDAEDRLELVVGQLRAAALRRLEQPLMMQTLAVQIQCAASTATYHCDLLESAGLVTRDRRGAVVWVMRTRAGDALVDLLS
jgi:hypothetical protein